MMSGELGITPEKRRVVRDGNILIGAVASAGADFGASLLTASREKGLAEAGADDWICARAPCPDDALETACPDAAKLLTSSLHRFVGDAVSLVQPVRIPDEAALHAMGHEPCHSIAHPKRKGAFSAKDRRVRRISFPDYLPSAAFSGSDGSHATAIVGVTSMQTESFDRILRIRAVLERTGLSRSTLYRKIQLGRFPRQIAISERCAGWRESAVKAWAEDPANYRTVNNIDILRVC